MTTNQFLRKVTVNIGSSTRLLSISNLFIEFSVEKTLGLIPNSCTISIHNLSSEKRSRIKNEFENISIEAGYENNTATIFSGQIRNIWHRRSKSDIITDIFSGDGDVAYSQGKINTTIGKGTTDLAKVIAILKTMPSVIKGDVSAINDTVASSRASTFNGSSKDEMTKIAEKNDAFWSIQDGKMQALKKTKSRPIQTNINSENGMVGNAVITEKGIEVATLLNPNLIPGSQIRIKSNFLETNIANLNFEKRDVEQGGGLYRIDKLVHSGDNKIGAFLTQIDGQRLNTAGSVIKKLSA